MVGPGIKDPEERFWESKKISSIRTTFKDFLETIDKKISKNVRTLGKVRPNVDSPIFSKFIISPADLKPSENLSNFISKDVDFIHPAISSPNVEAKQFYKGYFENWDPIIRNLDVDRSLKDGILSEVFIDDYYASDSEGQFLFVVKGFAGSGKSVLIKRIAYDAGISFDKFCLVVKPNTYLKFEVISELYNYVKLRIFLFVDNVLSREEEIIRILEKAKKENIPISIIGAERINIWNSDNALKNYLTTSYTLEYLNDKEIKELLILLQRHNSLGFLESKNQQEREKLLSYQAGRELLVALYEATHGRPFRDIVKDEYDKIAGDKAKSLYLTVCILHRLGSVARAGLISRVHGISFDSFKQQFFRPLEFIVFDRRDYKINDYVYQTRHPHIADMVFETVLTDEQSRFDEYIRIISFLNVDFDSDRNAFLAMTNARKLMELFPDRRLIRNLYKIATEKNPNNPKLLQQQSIFELEGNDILKAEELIKAAHKLSEDDPVILHTFAELEYKKAEKAKNRIEKEAFLKQAIHLCENLLKKPTPTAHPFHTILKSLVSKLEIALNEKDGPSIERTIKEVEKRFRDAKQHFPNQEFILEVESRFNELIHQTPEALELLEKAYNINKSSPFIASRLANFYEQNNEIPKAKEVLHQTLKFIPGDKDVNYEYSRLIALEDPTNYTDSLYYLRRSFTEGDNRFQAQFWYARALYLSGDRETAKSIFKKLSASKIDPDIKSKPNGLVIENNKPKNFTGKVITIETSYGFLRRDVFGDELYFYRFESNYNWALFKDGPKVTFNLAFNYRGPMAVNIKVNSSKN